MYHLALKRRAYYEGTVCPLLVSVLLSLTEVVVAEQTRIFRAILPIPPQHVTGPKRVLGCDILNVSRKAISSGKIAMYGPAKMGSVGLGSAIFGPLEPERSSGVFGGPVPQGLNSVFCRVTFDGKRTDVRASLTVFSEGLVPIFTIPFE
jgi:hypothetical protein